MGVDLVIRVLIVDDQRLVRQGFQAVLCSAADIEVIGEARDGMEAIEMVERLHPDVVTMDVKMPRMDGLQATRSICSADNSVRVVVIAGTHEESVVSQAIECGAKGYVAKIDMVNELAPSIRSVYRGNPYFSARLAGQNTDPGAEPTT